MAPVLRKWVVVSALVVLGGGFAALLLLESKGAEFHQMLRSEALAAAVSATLAEAAEDTGDPSMIGELFWTDTPGSSPAVSCSATPSEVLEQLRSRSGRYCAAAKAQSPTYVFPTLARFNAARVNISVSSELWNSEHARSLVLATLLNKAELCRLASTYGPNKRFDAAAIGCDGAGAKRLDLWIEVRDPPYPLCRREQRGDGVQRVTCTYSPVKIAHPVR